MRPRLLIALAGAAVGGAAAAALWSEGGAEDLLTAIALGFALGWARSHPRATWMFAAFVLVAAGLGGDVAGGDDFVVGVLVVAHAFCAGRWDPLWNGYGALMVLAAAGLIGAVLAHGHVLPPLFAAAAGWGAGRAVRSRELVAAQLAERARELDEEREAYAALSVRYERTRIASELHDIVAHAISVMVVQASAGQRLAARDPASAASTFETIAEAAREAEEDMGRLVALLGDADEIGPAPDLVLVEELVARASGSGLDVALRLEGEREGLPAPVVQACYRVVQEGLTNALRYSAGAAVSVVVRGERDALLVEVANGPAASAPALAGTGTGSGLIGLRRRVAESGGTVEAGPTADGGWLLQARLPRGRQPHRGLAVGRGAETRGRY